jgi:hypothetical protein
VTRDVHCTVDQHEHAQRTEQRFGRQFQQQKSAREHPDDHERQERHKLAPVHVGAQLEAHADRADTVEDDHGRDHELQREQVREQRHCDERRAETRNAEDHIRRDDDERREDEYFKGRHGGFLFAPQYSRLK